MLRLGDLPALYREVGREEAIAIAELGVQVYQATHDRLNDLWTTQQSAEEGTRAEGWKAQGAAAALESLKGRLAAGDAAAARVAALQAGVDAEVDRRLADALASAHKDAELAKSKAQRELELQLAEARGQLSKLEGKEDGYTMLREAHTGLRRSMLAMEEELQKYRDAAGTKTSHMLGKIGEIQLLDMLQKHVLPRFPYAEVKDMTAVKKSADFHIWIMSPKGSRVKLLLDSKKYKDIVPNVEIEKMYSDIDGDADANCGIMISWDTAISARSQFQITRTPKNKLCMFLTFEHMDDGIRSEVLCWALRVMVGMDTIQDTDTRDVMVEKIELFMKELSHSVTDLDGCMKACKTLTESLRSAKDNLVERITQYRVSCGIDGKEEVGHTEIALSARCRGVKPNGERCKFRHVNGSEYCTRHIVDK